VTTLKDKPFAVIGVNSWHHGPSELKTVMTQQKINWRTFDDMGKINRQWNFPATPAFYIIDHKGTIRRKDDRHRPRKTDQSGGNNGSTELRLQACCIRFCCGVT